MTEDIYKTIALLEVQIQDQLNNDVFDNIQELIAQRFTLIKTLVQSLSHSLAGQDLLKALDGVETNNQLFIQQIKQKQVTTGAALANIRHLKNYL